MSVLRGLIQAGVRNPVYANMLMVCILAGGIWAGRSLVNETYPEFSLDRVAVEAAYPGAGPEEIEEGVCIKIERALEGLAGIRRIWSRTGDDGGLVMVELSDEVDDVRQMVLDVKNRVDQITTFPPDVEPPIVSERLARRQVINLAIYGPVRERALKELAVEVQDELQALPEVSQINLVGVRDYEISIQVSREALLQYGLSIAEVAAIVKKNCLDLPAGTLRTHNEALTLRTQGQRFTAAQFEDLVIVARGDGTLVKLGQFATVTDGFSETYRTGRFDGQPAAILEIYKTPAQSTSVVAAAVRAYAKRKGATLPGGVRLATWADSSREVNARIAMLLENGALGMVLVVIVLALFLDLRVSAYVALGIPVSFAGGLIVMRLTGQTLNMLTLFGLIMVTGIIVDDAIVIADSFRTRRLAGDAPALAAVEGTTRVGLPVLASSLTTIVAFAPLLFVVGIMGKFIAVLPVVVIATIVFSSLEAFGILPAHLQHCRIDESVSRGWRGMPGRWRRAVERGLERCIEGVYRPLLLRAIRARGVTLALALACLVIAAGLFYGGRVPFTLLPQVDGDILRARVRYPPGVPLERTERAVARLERAAAELNDPRVIAHAGSGELVAQRLALVGEWTGWVRETGSHLCEVMIELLPSETRGVSGDKVLRAWRERTGVIDDALVVTFDRLERGPTEKPLEIRLLGEDLHELQVAADELAAKLGEYAGVFGVEHDLRPGRREVRVRLKPLARTLGVTVDDLARQLRGGFYGGEAVRVQRGREEVRVQVRYPDAQRKQIADLERVRIHGPDGADIPILELADYDITTGYAAISRQDGKRRVRVMANVDERRANAERILADLSRSFLPELEAKYPGVVYRLEGQHAQMLESMRSLLSGFLLALVVIYAVLASMLHSYVQPVIIMLTIPLGIIGAIVGHWVMGLDLTIMSVFGMVGLSGVVVNDAVVLLDQINQRLDEDPAGSVIDAVVWAGRSRFRAVILTTLTTVAGLAPLMFERSAQAQTIVPMAVSLTFGLSLATVLTLVVVPAMFLAVNDGRRFFRWLHRGGSYPSAEAVALGRTTPYPAEG